MLSLFVVLLLSVSAAAWRHQSHAKATVTTTVYVTVSTCVLPSTSSTAASTSTTSSPPFPTASPFTLFASLPGSSIDQMQINATGNQFFIGEDTATFCPVPTVPLADCPTANTTVFVLGGAQMLSMDVEVPGGQLVYVQSNGALGFTVAHSAGTPAGSVESPFGLTEDGVLTFTGLGATGFVACPTAGTFPFQIFANVAGGSFDGCLSFTPEAVVWTDGPGAWQYT